MAFSISRVLIQDYGGWIGRLGAKNIQVLKLIVNWGLQITSYGVYSEK